MELLRCLIFSIVVVGTFSLPPYNQQPQPPYGFVVFLNNTQNLTEKYDSRGCKSNDVNTTLSHHMFLGCVKSTDKLLFVQQFNKPGRFWSARRKIVDYPGVQQPGILPPVITGIRIYDNYYDGKGGYSSITSGGINYRHVRLELYSKTAGRGINFTLKIYGN